MTSRIRRFWRRRGTLTRRLGLSGVLLVVVATAILVTESALEDPRPNAPIATQRSSPQVAPRQNGAGAASPPHSAAPDADDSDNRDSSSAASSSNTRLDIAELTAKLQTSPNDVEARIERARLYYRRDEFDKFEADLTLAAKLAPVDPRVWALYGDLQNLRNRRDEALAAYDKAIELGLKDVDVFCKRADLRRGMGKYSDAINDWTSAIGMLQDETDRDRERVLRRYLYHSRGRAWIELENWDQALIDFQHLLAIDPDSATPRAYFAHAHLARGEYDQFTACMLEAMRLNPGDVGVQYEPTSDRTLSPEALQHGEQQVRQLLHDRPEMGAHVVPDDELWTWAVRKFAGEDFPGLVSWDSSDPGPFPSDARRSKRGGGALVRLTNGQLDATPPRTEDFESLWSRLVFELHNVASSAGPEEGSRSPSTGTPCPVCPPNSAAKRRTRWAAVRTNKVRARLSRSKRICRPMPAVRKKSGMARSHPAPNSRNTQSSRVSAVPNRRNAWRCCIADSIRDRHFSSDVGRVRVTYRCTK